MTMQQKDVAILFSGGRDCLAIYALLATGGLNAGIEPVRIHLLQMLNGMSRFATFPAARLTMVNDLLKQQTADPQKMPETCLVDLDVGRLFQGLWLDRYEELMPKYNGKNLVCVACKLAMHTRAILYCMARSVSVLYAGYTKNQSYFPEQTRAFMERIVSFSSWFGVDVTFPLYDEIVSEDIKRHILEDLGLPSTGGGERKCLFSQTLTTATETEIVMYLDDFIPITRDYIEKKLEGRHREAALCFPPGRSLG